MSNHSSHIRALYDAIRRSPSIASNVRELWFSAGIRFCSPREDAELSSILPALLRSFVGLRKLKFDYVVWQRLAVNVRKAFADILDLPSLLHVEMESTYFSSQEHFTNLLRPHLKRLAVNVACGNDLNWKTTGVDNAVVGEDKQDVMVTRQPCRIEYLKLVADHDFVNWLLRVQSVIDLSNIDTLEVVYNAIVASALVELIKCLRLSLRHLILRHSRECWCELNFFFFPFYVLLFKNLFLLHNSR
jgi:hypothetical protein